jgi:hypothetical protein
VCDHAEDHGERQKRVVQLRKRSNSDSSPFDLSRDGGRVGTAPRPRRDTTATLPSLDDNVRPRPRAADSNQELTEELIGMAASVGEVDPRASERLEDLAHAVGTETGRQRWADVDLRRAFNTEWLAHAYAVRREGGYSPPSVDKADKVRNVMVLLPILLTCAALAEAVRSYQHYIAAHPDEVRLPSLLLWQQGFGKSSGILTPTFSSLAIIDATIIFIIIVLTFYSHGRREQHEDVISATARRFQTDLDNTLAEATIVLAADRAGRPAMLARSVERLAERFDISTQELLTRLRVEHDRLEAIAARREKEFEDFGVFASGMRAGAEETHRLLIDLRQVSTGLQTALEDLTSEISVTGDQQRSLLGAVNSLERMVASGTQSDHAVARQLADAAKALSDTSDKALAGAESAAQAGRVATDAVRGIAEISSSLAAGQSRMEHAVANESEANARLADSLRSTAGGVASATRALGEITSDLSRLREEFRNIAIGISSVRGSREGAEELAPLVKRLDALTTQLARPTGATIPDVAPNTSHDTWTDRDRDRDRSTSESPSRPDYSGTGRRDRGLWPRREG